MKKTMIIVSLMISLFGFASIANGQSFYGTADMNSVSSMSDGLNLGMGKGEVLDIMSYEDYLISINEGSAVQTNNANDFISNAPVSFEVQTANAEAVALESAGNNAVVEITPSNSPVQNNEIIELVSSAPVAEAKNIIANDFISSDFVFVNDSSADSGAASFLGNAQAPAAANKRSLRVKNVGKSAWTTDYYLTIVSANETANVYLPCEVAPGQMIDLTFSNVNGANLNVTLNAESGASAAII